MNPVKVIGFRAKAAAGYDCSFTVSFPAGAPIHPENIQWAVNWAVHEARKLHGIDMQILSQHERIIAV